MADRETGRSRAVFAVVPIAIAVLLETVVAVAAECPSPEPSRAAVVARVGQFYEALRHDDLPALRGVVTEDFYAFDAGARYTADSLVGAVRDGHARGLVFDWKPGPADVHVTCDSAWLSYVNQGAITDGTGTHATTWLESAVFVYRHDRWRIRFFHSSKVAPGG